MDKQQWYRAFNVTLLMYEMDVELSKPIHGNLRLEMRQLIQLSLDGAPIVLGLPRLGKAPDVCSAQSLGSLSYGGVLEIGKEKKRNTMERHISIPRPQFHIAGNQ
jgi:hypothetical protein